MFYSEIVRVIIFGTGSEKMRKTRRGTLLKHCFKEGGRKRGKKEGTRQKNNFSKSLTLGGNLKGGKEANQKTNPQKKKKNPNKKKKKQKKKKKN